MKQLYCCFIIICLILIKTLVTAQLEAEIIPPLIYNAHLQSKEYGTFTCITRNSDDVRWIIDGVAHNFPSIVMTRLIRVDPFRLGHSVIRIPAIPVNQHIVEIKCKAYELNEYYQPVAEFESMETAQFNVQGLLDMPPNITYSSYNISHNLIEWLEPETLNITNVEPDIENYTICTNVTDECLNTTTTHFILPKHFVDVVINVTAWNIVGESNSFAQLLVEACNAAVLTIGQGYLVEIAFGRENITIVHIIFINDHIESQDSSWIPSTKECVYLYEVTIQQENDQFTVTRQVYGYHHSVTLKVPLRRNQLYSVNVTRVISSIDAQLALTPVNFNTFDVQNVTVKQVEDPLNSALQIFYHLAAGATVQGLILQIMGDNETLLERSFNTSEECGSTPIPYPCFVNKTIKISQQISDNLRGNISISVLGREKSGIVSNLYFQKFRVSVEAPVYILTSTYTATSAMLTSSSTVFMSESSTNGSSSLIIASVGGSVLGMGTFCLVCSSICIVIIFIKKHTKKAYSDSRCSKELHQLGYEENPQLVSNEAYSLVLPMNQNEAYETTLRDRDSNRNTTDQPHVYDEINLPPAVPNSAPVYAEIAEQSTTKVKVL